MFFLRKEQAHPYHLYSLNHSHFICVKSLKVLYWFTMQHFISWCDCRVNKILPAVLKMIFSASSIHYARQCKCSICISSLKNFCSPFWLKKKLSSLGQMKVSSTTAKLLASLPLKKP